MALPNGLRHRKEKTYGVLVLVVSLAVWLFYGTTAIVLILQKPKFLGITVFYTVLIALVLLISRAFYRAYIVGHYVMVSPDQFPTLFAAVQRGAQALGMARTPRAFVFNGNGVLSAFAVRLFGTPYVLLTASLIDAETDSQVHFVVGHELGHHAAGHLNFWKNLLLFPGRLVPLLGTAYYRSRELTCDRVGAYLVQDPDAARGALAMLACGSARLNAQLNCDAFEAQEALVPGLSGWLLHIVSPYPRLTARVAAVAAYYRQPKAA